jgi:hypothetical protein
VINNPYSGFVGSQTVFVPIGDPPTITRVSQNGNTITVDGTGFANGAVVNFFNQQPNGGLQPRRSRAGGDREFERSAAIPGAAGRGAGRILSADRQPAVHLVHLLGSDPDGGFTLH